MTITQLMAQEDFVGKLYIAQSFDQVQAMFRKEGVEITQKDLLERVQLFPGPNGELSERALEKVSGGGSLMSWILELLQ